MANNFEFTRLLISLAEDPAKLQALRNNPDQVLSTTSLTPVEQSLARSIAADPSKIRDAVSFDLGQKAAAGGDTTVVVVVVVVAVTGDQELQLPT